MMKLLYSMVFCLLCYSCLVKKPSDNFKFKSCNCNQGQEYLLCNDFNFKTQYSSDSLISLLHNSNFVLSNKRNGCCVKILENLASNIGYQLHQDCEINPQTCFYDSYFLYDTMAYLYRYDLRKLVSLYHYKDSSKLDNTIYLQFKSIDTKLLITYKTNRYLDDNLVHKFDSEDCRIASFTWPDLNNKKGVNEAFEYLLWEDSSLFSDYGYISCKKNFLIWTLAATKNYTLNRFIDGDGSYRFYNNGYYLSYDFSVEFKSDLRNLMQLYNYSDSSKYLNKYWNK